MKCVIEKQQSWYTEDIGNLVRTIRKYKRIWRKDIANIEKMYAFDLNHKITHQAIWNAEMGYFKAEFARNK